MDKNENWGCIGYVILALIIEGLIEDAKITFIIIGILLGVFVVVMLVSNFLDKRLRRKIERKKKTYPHAYSFFLREKQRFKSEDNLTKQEIEKILSISKTEWERREELELKRIQQEKQVLAEYDTIKSNYSDGLACWEKEHPSASKFVTVSNVAKIMDFDRRQKEFLMAEEWELKQSHFSKLCRSKKTIIPHSGCYFYNVNFPKTNYKGELVNGKYQIWQFFFGEFCTANDLDYSHFRHIQENNNNIERHREGKIESPSYIRKEIYEFIKSLDVPVEIITFGAEFGEDSQMLFLTLDLAMFGLQSSSFYVDELSSNYVVIIDGVTTQGQFMQRSESVIKKFRHQKPCIVYISLMKEYSQEELQKLIDEKNIEVQKQQHIKDEISSISSALKCADIETTKEKVQEIKNFAHVSNVDEELIDLINKAEEKVKNDYALGLVDDFDIQNVDYFIPPIAQDENNWKYPVVKYPKNSGVVFPYRRKIIARRGFSEIGFQNYLQEILKGYDLLIFGDCNILPVEDNRPFEPDIAIICKEYPSIRIDIEIDEPYAAITRKPIHYVGCGDDFRDALLNNAGWIVIRFTEYQVFSCPKECVAFIVQVLHCIKPSMALPIDFLSYSTPMEVERWTEIAAKVMASEHFREKYLNHEFGLVENEELDVSDIKQTKKEKICTQRMTSLFFETYHKENNDEIERTAFYEKDVHIQFYPQEHIYLYNGRELFIPVSSVISCFFKPFDSFYCSEYKSNQRNVPQGQVLEEWDAKGA